MKDLPILYPEFNIRAPEMADVEAVTALVAICDVAEYGKAHYSSEMIRANWHALDLAHDAWLIINECKSIVGYAGLWYHHIDRMFSTISVHPEYREYDLEGWLFKLASARAEEQYAEQMRSVTSCIYVQAIETASRFPCEYESGRDLSFQVLA